MLILVGVVGVALVVLGALVLLRFPDRPGGRVRLMGLEVNSVGAGLPLVALGVLAVVTAGLGSQDGGDATTGESSGGGGGQVAVAAPRNTPSCITHLFDSPPKVAPGRRRTLPAEVDDVRVLGEAEPKNKEFGLVLTEGGKTVGAAKMTYDLDARQYRLDQLVDARCRRGQWTAPDIPGANPRIVNNYTTLHLTLGDALYTLELEAEAFVELELHRLQK